MLNTPSAEAQPSLAARAEFLRGIRDMAPIVAAASPFGVVFGALAVQKGLSFAEAVAMSAVIYAGASQFAALELWAPPLPVWAILFSVLAVNFRHVLYSAALGRKMRHWPAAGRLAGFGFMVDPVYALGELNAVPASAAPIMSASPCRSTSPGSRRRRSARPSATSSPTRRRSAWTSCSPPIS
jgi:predicted branched-subunit amino acid permease